MAVTKAQTRRRQPYQVVHRHVALQLAEEGLVAPDAPVTHLLPERAADLEHNKQTNVGVCGAAGDPPLKG